MENCENLKSYVPNTYRFVTYITLQTIGRIVIKVINEIFEFLFNILNIHFVFFNSNWRRWKLLQILVQHKRRIYATEVHELSRAGFLMMIYIVDCICTYILYSYVSTYTFKFFPID